MLASRSDQEQEAQAQEPTTDKADPVTINIRDYRVRFRFSVDKEPDGARSLQVSYTATNKKDRKDNLPVYGALIKFYNTSEQGEQLLGEIETNEEGEGAITVPAGHNYIKDASGNINFTARFEGSETLDAEESEISIKDVMLDLNLELIDSVKTITAFAYSLDSTGARVPVDDVEVNFYVRGMLSDMLIEQGSFDQGTYQFELKQSIHGDQEGNINFIAKIQDSDDFGNVHQMQMAQWGEEHPIESAKTDHTLWSEVAPIWMYVVLTIMLVGVWANYIYTIIHLFQIRNDSREITM
jgi:hypothetical protein